MDRMRKNTSLTGQTNWQTWYEWREVLPALAERYTMIAPADDAIVQFTTLNPDGCYNPVTISEAAICEYTRCYAAEGGRRAGFEYYRALFTSCTRS